MVIQYFTYFKNNYSHLDDFDKLFVIFKNLLHERIFKNSPFADVELDTSYIPYKYLQLGFEFINNGYLPLTQIAFLEFELIKLITSNDLSDKEQIEMHIIKQMIPIIQENNFDEFFEISLIFCSNTLVNDIIHMKKLVDSKK